MMSRDMGKLVPGFRDKANTVLAACADRGITMRPFFTERTPWEQARIWRSTRSGQEVQQSIGNLMAHDASYLGRVLEMVGPQYSPPSARGHLTNALPGLSWHQWGEALDCFWLLDNRAIWSTKSETTLADGTQGNGYQVYADEALQIELLSAGLSWGWDWPHIQLRPEGSPHDAYSWKGINSTMLDKFGTTEAS